jgi:hypothetical protein
MASLSSEPDSGRQAMPERLPSQMENLAEKNMFDESAQKLTVFLGKRKDDEVRSQGNIMNEI